MMKQTASFLLVV